MGKPTQLEMIRHLSEHYGLRFTEVAAIMKAPTHPADMRDNFALFAMQGLVAYPGPTAGGDVAARAYAYADAMLAERVKPK